MTQHPITPPTELVQQWWHEAALRKYNGADADKHVTSMAAQWGADRELEACLNCMNEWGAINNSFGGELADELRAARRPKPPSLKQQALLAVDTAVADYRIAADVADVVRRALEQIDD
jgi:hypothetical protein